MTEPEPRALLLDVMSTLVYDPFHAEMPAFFGLSFEELMAAKHPDAWQRFERGELAEEEFLRSFFADGRAFDHAGFRACVRGGYRWLAGMRELVAELARAGRPLHALSNYPSWYRMIEEQLELSRYLDWSFVSCDMGVRKPDPEAFLIPARRLGLAPQACVFVDDQARNCEAAAALGMDAILFEGAPALRSALRTRGLLPDASEPE